MVTGSELWKLYFFDHNTSNSWVIIMKNMLHFTSFWHRILSMSSFLWSRRVHLGGQKPRIPARWGGQGWGQWLPRAILCYLAGLWTHILLSSQFYICYKIVKRRGSWYFFNIKGPVHEFMHQWDRLAWPMGSGRNRLSNIPWGVPDCKRLQAKPRDPTRALLGPGRDTRGWPARKGLQKGSRVRPIHFAQS